MSEEQQAFLDRLEVEVTRAMAAHPHRFPADAQGYADVQRVVDDVIARIEPELPLHLLPVKVRVLPQDLDIVTCSVRVTVSLAGEQITPW